MFPYSENLNRKPTSQQTNKILRVHAVDAENAILRPANEEEDKQADATISKPYKFLFYTPFY